MELHLKAKDWDGKKSALSQMHRILVTGGNSGIGYALCKILASQAEPACHVLLGARSVT